MSTQTRKVLGQAFPAAATLTKLYTAPSQVQVSSLVANNQSASVADEIKVSIRIAGAADAQKQYLYGSQAAARGLSVYPLDSFGSTIGVTLASTDEVWVYSLNGTSSFSLYGAEIS